MDGRLDAKPRFQRLIKVPNGNTGQKSPIINAAILINDFGFARALLSSIRSPKSRGQACSNDRRRRTKPLLPNRVLDCALTTGAHFRSRAD